MEAERTRKYHTSSIHNVFLFDHNLILLSIGLDRMLLATDPSHPSIRPSWDPSSRPPSLESVQRLPDSSRTTRRRPSKSFHPFKTDTIKRTMTLPRRTGPDLSERFPPSIRIEETFGNRLQNGRNRPEDRRLRFGIGKMLNLRWEEILRIFPARRASSTRQSRLILAPRRGTVSGIEIQDWHGDNLINFANL